MDDFSAPLMFPGIYLESDKGLFDPFVLQDGADVGGAEASVLDTTADDLTYLQISGTVSA